ncbi:dihydrofolate reductase family protein [Dietzia timorensis]|uniref:Uncharacterized protein YyaP n=1 Tax=Dietzia timorensis TaxID=499555 RepID=A0A173LQE2_9ACTN|nr:dihydrofolate reductase family protein [Dietzia timorensis]ANI93968.1 Uncharacterized protein YyaP [Dietzia timorensis]
MTTTNAQPRSLVISQNCTLDGSIEMLGEWFDPQESDQGELDQLLAESERCDALLLGRQTFEDFRSYWPNVENDQTGITDDLNAQDKFVVSSTMTDPQWSRTTIFSGDWERQVRDLKQQGGGDIVVTGSIKLCHALIEAGLVDEFRLYLYPAVQGRGRRLFPEGFESDSLSLVESHPFANGHVELIYRAA